MQRTPFIKASFYDSLSTLTVDSTGSFCVISTIYNSTKQGSALRCIEVFQMAQFRMGMWCLQSPFRNGHLYGSGIFGTERLIVWFQCCAAVLHWILLYGISDWSVEGTSNHQGCPPYQTTNRVSGVFLFNNVSSWLLTLLQWLICWKGGDIQPMSTISNHNIGKKIPWFSVKYQPCLSTNNCVSDLWKHVWHYSSGGSVGQGGDFQPPLCHFTK